MVVPVLMTNCHVSEKWNIGPVAAHTTTTKSANKNTDAEPVQTEILLATTRKTFFISIIIYDDAKNRERYSVITLLYVKVPVDIGRLYWYNITRNNILMTQLVQNS